MSIATKWFDKEFERKVLKPEMVNVLNRMGATGERISKQLIAGPGPLHAVDKSILLNSMAFDPATKSRLAVRIGTNTKYAIHVFMGFIHYRSGKHIKAKPILRTMLHMLKSGSK